MKNARMTICLVAAILVIATGQGFCTVNFNDGGIHNIDYPIYERVFVGNGVSGEPTTVNVLNGAIISGPAQTLNGTQDSRINIYGGSVGSCFTGDNGQITMSGGIVVAAFGASGNGQLAMSGGNAGYLQAWGNSHVVLSGGSVNGFLAAFDSSHITIVGSNFAIDGSPVSFGQYFASDFPGNLANGYIDGHGVLTGTLDSGALLNNSFGISTDASITLIPEPTTLLLLGLGAVIIRRKRS